jgi:hypothetical protein
MALGIAGCIGSGTAVGVAIEERPIGIAAGLAIGVVFGLDIGCGKFDDLD